MRLYLSGPMTGRPFFNYAAFHRAAARLRAQGHEVFNPAECFGGDTTRPYADYMREDIAAVLTADAVCVLPGWEWSKGARLEVTVAVALGLPVLEYASGDGPQMKRLHPTMETTAHV